MRQVEPSKGEVVVEGGGLHMFWRRSDVSAVCFDGVWASAECTIPASGAVPADEDAEASCAPEN